MLRINAYALSQLVMSKNSGLESPKTVVQVGWMYGTGHNQQE